MHCAAAWTTMSAWRWILMRRPMLLSATMLMLGCNQSNQSSAKPRGLSLAQICPPDSPAEQINPQSRDYRGGCLEKFQHFYVDNDVMPPARLPEEVTGYHFKFGDLKLKL